MATAHLVTIIVIGVLVGFLSVAISHAQLVWLKRRRQTREPRLATSPSPLPKWLPWACAGGAVGLGLYSVCCAELPERDGFLIGSGLFSVRPRPGLVARFETGDVAVRRGDLLVRFTGQDGDEGSISLEKRRARLQNELEAQRARPLDLDPDAVRHVDAAHSSLHEIEQRKNQLVSERDSIVREMAQQRFTIANRVYRLEQDDHAVENELAPLRASHETEKEALRTQERQAKAGYITRLEANRKRAAFAGLEGRLEQLDRRRALFAREKKEVDRLRSLSEAAYALQLRERSIELEKLDAKIAGARDAVARAAEALERDRPRAQAQRDHQLQQIKAELEACQALLDGNDRSMSVAAPFDGRVGFRDPSPAKAPADNGPLLVLYRPGQVRAAVRVEAGESDAASQDLGAEVRLSPLDANHAEPASAPIELGGTIVQRTLRPDGPEEILVGCDPPAPIVRQLAMGATLPVRVQLHRSVTSTRPFRAGVGLAALGLLLVVGNAFRRSLHRPASPPGSSPRGGGLARPRPPASPSTLGPLAVPWSGRWDAGAGVARTHLGFVRSLCGPPWWRAGRPTKGNLGRECLHAKRASRRMERQAWRRPVPLLARVTLAAPELDLPGDDPGHLQGLGATLRMQIERGVLAPELVRQVGDALARGGFQAAGKVALGFGVITDQTPIEQAAFGLLASAPAGTLGEATRECAALLRIMRAIAPEAMIGALDRLRLAIIAAALAAAAQGLSRDVAATTGTPLVEA